MAIQIKIQHLASIEEIELNPTDSLDILKKKIKEIYSIPVDQQSLTLEDRNIGTYSKQLDELGLRDGSVVVVKKIHRVTGKIRSGGMGSLIKNPMVKSMLKNPQTIKSIQDMFPGLKDEMAENSSLNMLMSNEGLEDELEKFAADDDYMNTQLRNADITMAKLENLPEGIKIMSSLAKDTQNLSSFQVPPSELKGGERLTKKNLQSLPGQSKKNSLVEYRKQLFELKQIGFENVRENVQILNSVNGDFQSALEILVRKYDGLA